MRRRMYAACFAVLFLVLALVPQHAQAAPKKPKTPKELQVSIGTYTRKKYLNKGGYGYYKLSLEDGKTAKLTVKDGKKDVTKKCKFKVLRNPNVISMKKNKVVPKDSGYASILVTYKKKATQIDVRIAFKEPDCKHKWEYTWKVRSYDEEYESWMGDTVACQCGPVAASIYEKHLVFKRREQACWQKYQQWCGMHGTKAKAAVSTEKTETGVRVKCYNKYVESMVCKKCGLGVDVNGYHPKKK